MPELAESFAATLSRAQRARLHQEYSAANAARWSNFPQSVLGRRGRLGLRTGTLDPEQWRALNTLLAAATGTAPNRGYDRIQQHLDADDHLRAHGAGHGYGRGNFYVAFLGAPSDTGRWELQFGGHHLAVANTYADGVLAGATPSFRGIEPFAGFQARDGVREPERQAREALAALLAALGPAQSAAARLGRSHHDLLLGPGQDWAFPSRAEGIAGVELTAGQRALLLAAIEEYVADVDEESAARILAGYARELDATHVAWTGSASLLRPGDYIRIDGPSVWVEFSMHDGIVLADPHPHAVWRDKNTDYGGREF
ncbi:DUF3500 domain-containing protein [Streptomyces sp. NPDC088812]|uniref:DUF3500 domain-containing protein n=1 Tax=Streptomyces sp. NPDC088812 TaxID=3365905 RepID=UPI0037FC6475